MKKLNQMGFTAIEGTLVVVVLVLIGGIGFMINNSNKMPVSQTTSSGSQAKQEEKKTPSRPVFSVLPTGWTEYKNDEKGLRLGFPKEWGTFDISTLRTPDYKDDVKNMQGVVGLAFSPKENFSISASKYGATIKVSSDGKTWTVVEENPAAADGYKVGDTYKTKNVPVNGATAIDITIHDEDCTHPRWILPLKDSYAVVSMPELCPANLVAISDQNRTAYTNLTNDFIKAITVY